MSSDFGHLAANPLTLDITISYNNNKRCKKPIFLIAQAEGRTWDLLVIVNFLSKAAP